MNIEIDGKQMNITGTAMNIVEVAQNNGITMIAPCYRNDRKFGCCNACLIEVNGKRKYACSIKPDDNMKIVYNREDLADERKKKLAEYVKNIKSGKRASCCGESDDNDSCSGDDKEESSCCSDSSCGCG